MTATPTPRLAIGLASGRGASIIGARLNGHLPIDQAGQLVSTTAKIGLTSMEAPGVAVFTPGERSCEWHAS